MIQNLAYGALVEDQMKERVPYGLVVYAGKQVRRVEFTESNRKWLMQTISAVQAARLQQEAMRNHNQRGRCSGCGVRDQCDQALRCRPPLRSSIRHDPCLVLTLALAGPQQFRMLWSKHVFFQKPDPMRRPATSDQKVSGVPCRTFVGPQNQSNRRVCQYVSVRALPGEAPARSRSSLCYTASQDVSRSDAD